MRVGGNAYRTPLQKAAVRTGFLSGVGDVLVTGALYGDGSAPVGEVAAVAQTVALLHSVQALRDIYPVTPYMSHSERRDLVLLGLSHTATTMGYAAMASGYHVTGATITLLNAVARMVYPACVE